MTMLAYTYTDRSVSMGIWGFDMGYSYSASVSRNNYLDLLPYADDEITQMCMGLSEGSLAKVWENEDDEYWASFLND